jgi:hypothetical protein
MIPVGGNFCKSQMLKTAPFLYYAISIGFIYVLYLPKGDRSNREVVLSNVQKKDGASPSPRGRVRGG